MIEIPLGVEYASGRAGRIAEAFPAIGSRVNKNVVGYGSVPCQ